MNEKINATLTFGEYDDHHCCECGEYNYVAYHAEDKDYCGECFGQKYHKHVIVINNDKMSFPDTIN